MPSSPRPSADDPAPRHEHSNRAAREPDQAVTAVDATTLRVAMDQAAESIVIADALGRLVYANVAAERQIGRPRSELIGRHFVAALPAGQDGAQFDDVSLAVSRGQVWSGTRTAIAIDGSPLNVDLVVSPVFDPAGRVGHVIAIGRDTTLERRLAEDLAREVRSHAEIVSTLSQLDASPTPEERAKQLADRLLDLDGVGFSRVVAFGPGDLWYRVAAQGHPDLGLGGPRPDRAFVRTVTRRVRKGAWVDSARRWASAGRIGVALQAAGISALAFAPIQCQGELVGLLVAASTESAGMSTLTRHLAAIEELAVVASVTLGASFAERKRAEGVRTEIERIIEATTFRPVYQPIVRLGDGEVLGYEALTRFEDGSSPDARFAEAAAVGLGLEFELATLEAAIAGAAALPPEALLSVNVSPALVTEGRRLDELISRSSRPRILICEITEREPVDDYAALRQAISRMRSPVRWAIDDAGAGYASLRHIIELRPQFVKLDRALIGAIALDPARQALVAGLLHFSTALGSVLIAEGIETEAERLVLERLGLTLGQGYLFGRPMPGGVMTGGAETTPAQVVGAPVEAPTSHREDTDTGLETP